MEGPELGVHVEGVRRTNGGTGGVHDGVLAKKGGRSHGAEQGGPGGQRPPQQDKPAEDETANLRISKIRFSFIRDSAQISFTDSLVTSH